MKKTLSLFLTAALAAGLLIGCGGAGGAQETAAPADSGGAAAESGAADGGAAGDSEAAPAASGEDEGGAGGKKIIVGATPVPHADILDNAVKQVLAEEGWELETMVFEDYVLPNTSLESGELDANYFQTLGYMDQQNTDAGLHLSAIAGVHIEPMGIYSEKYKAISEIPDGGEIGIPNDPDNGERGLLLLVQKGLLNSIGDYGKDQNYTADTLSQDKEANPHGYKITPLEAAGLPLSLPDLDAATINGNYALGASLPDKFPALEIEEFDEETSVKRTNFVVVRSGEEESEKSKALKAALQSDAVKAYIDDKYKGSVISSFIEAK